MKPVLLIDFGSTYTKVTAVDVDAPRLLGTANSYTTVQTDIMNGLADALSKLEKKTGRLVPIFRRPGASVRLAPSSGLVETLNEHSTTCEIISY